MTSAKTEPGTGGDGDFRGAKILLFVGGRLLVIRRDLKAGIPWPGYLDFPGGGREGSESATACALRETREEVGLALDAEQLNWRHESHREDGLNWFFAARLGADIAPRIRLGSEGSGWSLIAPEIYLDATDGIPHFRDILRLYLES